MKSVVAVSAFAVVFATSPLHAETVSDPFRKVSFADLDLNTPGGVRHLQHRLDAAVTDMCGEVDAGHLAMKASIEHCREVASASAEPQLAALVNKAHLAALAARR